MIDVYELRVGEDESDAAPYKIIYIYIFYRNSIHRKILAWRRLKSEKIHFFFFVFWVIISYMFSSFYNYFHE